MSTNAPFFSIIIPTYNRIHLVSRAVQSVFAQTNIDWELLVVDDGSTDGTVDRLKKENSDPRLIILSGPNQGRSAARNKGIESASGKYICFLDSDDEFFPSHLEVLSKYITQKNFPKSIIRTFAKFVYEDGKEELQIKDLIKADERPIDYILSRSTLFPSQVCIHREALDKFRFNTAFSLGEDTDFFARILAKLPLVCLNETTVTFHFHAENSQTGEMTKVHRAYIEVFQGLKNEPELKGKYDPKLISDLIQRRNEWLGAALKNSGDYPAYLVQKFKNIF